MLSHNDSGCFIKNKTHWGSLPSIQVKKSSLSVSLNAINPNLFGKKPMRAFKPTTKHEKNTVMRDQIGIRRYTTTITLHENDDTHFPLIIADYEPM